jgi:hypothetical protein
LCRRGSPAGNRRSASPCPDIRHPASRLLVREETR